MPLLLEHWKPVVGFEEHYAISNMGNVCRTKPFQTIRFGRHRKPSPDGDGRLQYILCIDGKNFMKKSHKMVAEAFIGPCPLIMEVNHKDGRYTNNRASNLEYTTHQRNKDHAVELGLMARGERNGNAKLTVDQVKAIRALEGMMTLKEAASRFGVTLQAIHHIQKRKLWRHVA